MVVAYTTIGAMDRLKRYFGGRMRGWVLGWMQGLMAGET